MTQQIKESITINEVIDFLNELADADPAAILALVQNRVPCNRAMANHPTVQVQVTGKIYMVGPLGILNGAFGVDENNYGPITVTVDDSSGDIVFTRTKHTEK